MLKYARYVKKWRFLNGFWPTIRFDWKRKYSCFSMCGISCICLLFAEGVDVDAVSMCHQEKKTQNTHTERHIILLSFSLIGAFVSNLYFSWRIFCLRSLMGSVLIFLLVFLFFYFLVSCLFQFYEIRCATYETSEEIVVQKCNKHIFGGVTNVAADCLLPAHFREVEEEADSKKKINHLWKAFDAHEADMTIVCNTHFLRHADYSQVMDLFFCLLLDYYSFHSYIQSFLRSFPGVFVFLYFSTVFLSFSQVSPQKKKAINYNSILVFIKCLAINWLYYSFGSLLLGRSDSVRLS